MKTAFLLGFLLSSIPLWGQSYITPQGEYMDTARVFSPKCAPPYAIFYYQVNAKYPVSSAVLLRETREYMKQKKQAYAGDGYITFRFFIDCEGIMSRVLVLQTDDNYKPLHFQKELVSDLYGFLKTMDQWKKDLEIQDLKKINYIAFVSFKIKNGEVVNIIP